MPQNAKQLHVSKADRAVLESWLRASKTPRSLALRARIVLESTQGATATEVAESLGVSPATVHKWRSRFEEAGLSGLGDRHRSGRPTKLTSSKTKQVLHLTTKRIPKESTHWSTRLMAKYAGVTQWQVRQIWQAADLKPHRIKSFKISNDPQFAEKVIDVVGLYMSPPDGAVVLSVDEKTQIQALDRTQPMLPLRPGQIERRTHDYKRHGTASLYAAFEVATGKVLGRVTQRHRSREFVAFLRQIEAEVAADLDVHLIVDNSSTHKTAQVEAFRSAHPRFHFHFTPTSASWLNAVESWFSQLERRSIHRGVFTSVHELRDEIKRYIKEHNAESAKPFVWTQTAEKIIKAVERAKNALQDSAN